MKNPDNQGRIKEIEKYFKAHADMVKAPQMEAYMKNHFSFYGIQKPIRITFTKPLVKACSQLNYAELKNLVIELWNKPQRELQYFAMDILIKAPRHQDSIKLFEYLIKHKSWWDSVDLIASKLVGSYFSEFPKLKDQYINKWTSSNNIWLIRTAILFQLKYKKETDVELLFKLIRQHKASEEFFIQKAIGWALREYAYTDARIVKQFVKAHQLKPLSEREALKHLK